VTPAPPRLSLRFARTLVRAAARRLPPTKRDRFLREWHGELDAEDRAGSGWRVLRMAMGAFADARMICRIADDDRRPTMSLAMNGLAGLIKDVSIAVRGLRRAPGFAAVAILTLAVGIGGSAAIFTVIKRVVIDPLPYPEAGRLVRLQNRVPGVAADAVWSLSTAQFVYFTDHAHNLATVGLYRGTGGNVMTPSGPQRARGVSVTASMMSLLGVDTAMGRAITADDDTPSSPVVALVSQGFWRRVLGASPSVIGTKLTYNDTPIEVIGVLRTDINPPGWSEAETPDLWLPMRVNHSGPFHNNHVFPAVARLAPGAGVASAEAELRGLTPHLPEVFPDAYSQAFFDRYGFQTEVVPLKQDVIGDLSRNLWILLGGVGLLLLVACANVANLFAVRMDARKRELGIRAALGAGRMALARYVLAEGLTLALVGAALALVVSIWALPALTALAPSDLPRIHTVTIGLETVEVAVGLALFVGLGLAMYPVLLYAGPWATRNLRETGRALTDGRERLRMRATLIVLQIALALTLAVGAGLLLVTLARFRAVDVGLAPKGVVALETYLSPTRYKTDDAIWRFDHDLLDRLRAAPGVLAAGLTEELPIESGFGCTVQGFEEQAVFDRIKNAGMTTCAGQEATSPGYFETMGIPLLKGRLFEDADNDDPSRAAVIVSKAFADRFWPGEDAIGKAVAPSGRTTGPFHHVVGIVGDVPRASDAGRPPLSQPAIAIYYPLRHDPKATWNSGWWPGYMSLVVKTSLADPTAILPAVRRVLADTDPEVPLANLTTMDTIVARATSQLSFVSTLLTIAAGVALLLAAVGLYGTISYVVARRSREIGMRLAIGAQPGLVQRAVVLQSLTLAGMGIVVGIGLALLAARAMRALLVGVAPTDLGVFVGAIGLLVTITLTASWIPARRAARIDPIIALRSE
jgi:putative ABC transport system permease protein